MKNFLDENFLLDTETAIRLYHDYAKDMPVIDYHCHLSPEMIAKDHRFENITQAWLYGDHYKWRAMRTNGVDEQFITGNKSDYEKFEQWAQTVPYTLRNPLYHWTHLELQRYFGITDLLNERSARSVYDEATAQISKAENSVRGLLKKMNVQVVCTTDDPLDSLEFHKQFREEQNTALRMFPAWRPDAAMNAGQTAAFNAYIDKTAEVSGIAIKHINDYLAALKKRHDYFAEQGCTLSDHGLEELYVSEYTDDEIALIFSKIRNGKDLVDFEIRKFKSAMLYHFSVWDAEKGWVQQFHLGALRNNNSRMMEQLGPDTGWDSIGDFSHGKSIAAFLDRLDKENKLAKTILYNLNPADNELIATMIGNFNDGSVPGKIQFGSGWWFLDQKDGMTRQLNALSNMGLLSKFVGMLTDSRSFLSFPRHEYFRRLLCNLFGTEIEHGELPDDLEWIGQVIRDICYNNAKTYFGW